MNGRAIKSLQHARGAGRRAPRSRRSRASRSRTATLHPMQAAFKRVPRPAVRLLHAGHGDDARSTCCSTTRSRARRRSARGSTATSAAAPATRTSSRRSSSASRARHGRGLRSRRMGDMNEAFDPTRARSAERASARGRRRFLTGAGQYTDDVVLHGQTYARLRALAARARARSSSIDLAAAKARRAWSASSPAPTSPTRRSAGCPAAG